MRDESWEINTPASLSQSTSEASSTQFLRGAPWDWPTAAHSSNPLIHAHFIGFPFSHCITFVSWNPFLCKPPAVGKQFSCGTWQFCRHRYRQRLKPEFIRVLVERFIFHLELKRMGGLSGDDMRPPPTRLPVSNHRMTSPHLLHSDEVRQPLPWPHQKRTAECETSNSILDWVYKSCCSLLSFSFSVWDNNQGEEAPLVYSSFCCLCKYPTV